MTSSNDLDDVFLKYTPSSFFIFTRCEPLKKENRVYVIFMTYNRYEPSGWKYFINFSIGFDVQRLNLTASDLRQLQTKKLKKKQKSNFKRMPQF